jgi:hypothetical protein
MKHIAVLLFFIIVPLLMASTVSGKTVPINDQLTWCGQKWGVDNIKVGNGNPTNWSSSGNNVWIDDNNMLHMKITKNNGEWDQCHLYSMPANQFKYGKFKITFNSPVLTQDPDVISTMFINNDWFQPSNDKYGDEMDIEFSGWGDSNYYRGWYTVQPAVSGNYFYDFMAPNKYDGTNMTCILDWEPDHVNFESIKSDGTVLNSFTCTNPSSIPTHNADVMLQNWLVHTPSSSGQDNELILSNYSYTPFGTNSTSKTTAASPVASFSATPTSGKRPLTVTFTDTSTGSPNSGRWKLRR